MKNTSYKTHYCVNQSYLPTIAQYMITKCT